MWPNDEFASATWIAAKPEERYRYTTDLMDSGRLMGMRRDEVKLLLGPPSAERERSFLSYTVKRAGAVDLLSLSTVCTLVLLLDNEDRVRDQTILAD
jgi:hypothetical protein